MVRGAFARPSKLRHYPNLDLLARRLASHRRSSTAEQAKELAPGTRAALVSTAIQHARLYVRVFPELVPARDENPVGLCRHGRLPLEVVHRTARAADDQGRLAAEKAVVV